MESAEVQDDHVLKAYTLPPISYFSLIKGIDKIYIDINENYQKRSYRNKYVVLSANGPMPLSIPLRQGKNNGQKIKEVQIAYDDNWVKRHVETLRSSYGKSAYFDHYFPIFYNILNKNHTFLYDLNFSLIESVIAQLKMEVKILESTSYLPIFNLHSNATQPYPQVFEDKYRFVANLSIIDLLFNMGPESKRYL